MLSTQFLAQKKKLMVHLTLCKFIKYGGANTEVWKIKPGYCKMIYGILRLDWMSWLYPSKIDCILNWTENKHCIITIHSLVFRGPSFYPEFSPFRCFFTPTIFGFATVILQYFLLPKRFEKYLKYKTNQNWNVCLLFFLKQKCNLSCHAQNRSFTSLLLGSF